MLIGTIISISIFAVSYALILIFFKNEKSVNYEIKTRMPRSYFILAHLLFFTCCLATPIAACVIIDSSVNAATTLVFLPTAIIGLLVVYMGYAQFEAIKGDKLYVRRFIKIREIKIEDVRSIEVAGRSYAIESQGFTLIIYGKNVNAEALIELLKSRKNDGYYHLNDDCVVYSDQEEREKLRRLGREYRENFPKYKRKQLLIIGIGFAVIFLVYFGVMSVVADYFILPELLIYGSILAGAFIFITLRIKKILERELERDDEYLGFKHGRENVNVKGSAKNKFKVSLLIIIVFCIPALVVSLVVSMDAFDEPVAKNSLTAVSGELEYIRFTRYDALIGLKDDPIEYRINSADDGLFDLDFTKEVSVSDAVTVYIVENEEATEFFENGRKGWVYAYVVKTDEKEYLSYENYVEWFENNRNIAFGLFVGGLSFSGVGIIASLIAFAVYKKRAEKETIELL